MSLKLSHSQRPHPLLWASLQAACGKITMNGIPNHLNYCVIFTVYTKFTNLSSGNINTNWQAVGSRPMHYTLMNVRYSKLMHDGLK
jgi:hypothetical protein